MNPFSKYGGVRINGHYYASDALRAESMHSAHPAYLREVFAFAAKLFDRNETAEVSTSGSTGVPKKMRFPKSAFELSAASTNSFFGITRNSRLLLALPMRYIAGKMMVARAAAAGCELTVAAPSSSPFAGKPDGYAASFDFVPLTPHQADRCADDTPKAISEAGTVLIGGGQVSDELRKKLLRCGVNAYASFGMTETLSHFAVAKITAEGDLLFKPLPGVEVKTDRTGRLRVKRKGITRGRLETNDLAELSGEGFYWKGRADNLINSGGIKVIPEQVEKSVAHLLQMPYFVAGIPHEKLGEEVALFIEAEDLPAADLLGEVQHALADTPFWQPRKLIPVSRFLYTDTGKIMRKATAERSLA